MTRAEPSDALVFFGATGDLAYKQIFPALLALVDRHDLALPIVGVASRPWTTEALVARARESLAAKGAVDESRFTKLAALLRYVSGDYHDVATFGRIRQELGEARRPLHYLAIPPSLFPTVVNGLAGAGCMDGARVVVEKPFGRDLASSRALDAILRAHFPEASIFRIDHFLGKEAIQNLLYARFANAIFEPMWNRTYVRSVQITMAETIGVEGRGRFYEETGAIRDVVQNHLLEVLALLAMDPPNGGNEDAIRSEKARLLKSVHPLRPSDVVRGQYEGYRAEPGVSRRSNVETFAAVRASIDNWRWAGVPFYIRTGKRLPVRATEVLVEFVRPPRESFGEIVPGLSNHFRFRLSPDVVIALGMRVKRPGEKMVGRDVELVAMHQTPGEMSAYERLLGDALHGDASSFARGDAVEAQWRIVEPVLGDATPVYDYEPGTWGPREAESLIARDGGWLDPKSS